VLVTGSTDGLGKEVARQLGALGAFVIVHGRNQERGEEVVRAIKAAGVGAGDRVAGYMPNMPETIIAMLAAASIGAIWSSCSPDFGIKGVLDRFGQIQPRVIFTADGYFFKGKKIDSLARMASILTELRSIERVVVVPYTEPAPDIRGLPNAVHWADFRAGQAGLQASRSKV